MENKELMERLLQDDKSSKATEKTEWAATAKAKAGENSISRIRVVTAKYKVYIVLLLIFIALLWFNYIPSAKDDYKASEGALSQVKVQLTEIERWIKDAEADMDYLCNNENWVVKNEEALKKCLNEREGCTSLPETWKTWDEENMSYDLSIPLSYLQLHSLYNEKMPVDEKVVLKNLNEYLIKQDMLWWDKSRVWDILRIEIGDPEAMTEWDEHFFEVPVDVEIEFSTIGELTGFLYNVEKRLIDNGEDRILYKIQSVSYDIVTNDEPQVTDISMIAYYYHDEKFNDKKECDDNSENTSENNEEANVNDEQASEESDESEDSGSFFNQVFGKLKK